MRLATFNILHGRSLADGRVDIARLQSACASLDADVLGLQEVDRDQERSTSSDLAAVIAEGVGARHWRFQPALVGVPGGAWQAAGTGGHSGEHRGEHTAGQSGEQSGEHAGPSYGVALVSRLPVTDWHTVRLPAARLKAPMLVPGTRRVVWIADEPRVALCARIEAGFGAVTVATTHLSFVPGWNAWQLRLLIRELRRLPGPYVLLGDLNLIGRIPALITGWRPLGTARTFPAPLPRVQIDHVLGVGDLPPVVTARAVRLPLSDHRALVVDLGGVA